MDDAIRPPKPKSQPRIFIEVVQREGDRYISCRKEIDFFLWHQIRNPGALAFTAINAALFELKNPRDST